MILEYWPKISINIYHMYLRVGSHWCVCSGVAPFLQWMSSLGSFSVKSIGAQATQLPISMVCPRAEQFNQLMTDSVLLVWEFLESFWLISLYRFNNVTAFWAQTFTWVHTLWKSTSAAQLHQSCHGPWPNSRTQSQLESQLACHGEKGATLAKGQLERLWHCSLIKVALVKNDKRGNYKQQHTMTRRFFSRPQRRRTLRVSSRSVFWQWWGVATQNQTKLQEVTREWIQTANLNVSQDSSPQPPKIPQHLWTTLTGQNSFAFHNLSQHSPTQAFQNAFPALNTVLPSAARWKGNFSLESFHFACASNPCTPTHESWTHCRKKKKI